MKLLTGFRSTGTSALHSTARGIVRGCSGCTCTPRVEKKIWGPSLQGKFVSAPLGRQCTPLPRGRARVQFFEEIGEIWMVGEVI